MTEFFYLNLMFPSSLSQKCDFVEITQSILKGYDKGIPVTPKNHYC